MKNNRIATKLILAALLCCGFTQSSNAMSIVIAALFQVVTLPPVVIITAPILVGPALVIAGPIIV
jgi:hypothetical protein